MVRTARRGTAVATTALESEAQESYLAVASGVDQDAKMIRDVKVAGLVSQNLGRVLNLPETWGDALDHPYVYAQESLREAVPLYEGARVYLDHPENGFDKAGVRVISPGDRKVADHFGRLVNVRWVEGDGIRGDIEYLESHPLAAKVVETAMRMPEQIALSHNARLVPSLQNGRVVISKIRRVWSVDMITENPGTTVTLFESAGNMAGMTVGKPAMENGAMLGVAPGASEIPALEEDGGEMTAATPQEQVTQAMIAAAVAILQEPGTKDEKLAKLGPILEQMDAINAVLSGKPAEGGGGDAAATEAARKAAAAKGATDVLESAQQQRLRELESKETARAVLESAGVQVRSIRVDMLAGLSKDKQSAAIAEFKKQDAAERGAGAMDPDSILTRSGSDGLESSGGSGKDSPSWDFSKVDGKAFADSLD